ncbi:MAG: carboxylesterase family protein [Porticoccaceae bacterium]|nr:carboxylesterase family protein [Porticoccaceae bacterium]
MRKLIGFSAILLISISIASCSLFGTSKSALQTLAEHNISTSTGITQGQSFASAATVVSWFDIPYAQPPVGDLRWRAPRELESPTQIIVEREDTSCVQEASRFAGVTGEGMVGSEDCLYLDIKAPADFATQKYPVMLWIHGGGNTTGLKDYYEYDKLVARKDVVVVAINYRLGALGWFSHPAIQGLQEDLDKTSNFGTLDIIQSLKWVKKNIAQFGGDADNVTIFGESAGGHNVLTLLASPLANGLFHKAISQSGYTQEVSVDDAYNQYGTNDLIARGGWQIANKLIDKPQADYSAEELNQILKGTNAIEFMSLYKTSDLDFDKMPLATVDGIAIPKVGILGALASAEYAKNVPVIAGATKDEVALWLALHRYFMDTSYILTKFLPPRITVKDPELYKLWVRTRSHAWKLKGVDDALIAMESAGYTDLYAYQFDWDHQDSSMLIDFPNLFGAAHGTDIAFVTGKFAYGPISSYIYPDGEARDQMENTVMSAWTNFAKSAVPNMDKPVQWQKFSSANPVFLHLDTDDALRMEREGDTISSLLEKMAGNSAPTDLERCYIAWETYTNVGNVDPEGYRSWNGGLCADIDMPAEQKAIAAELIAEHGSIAVL